MNWHASMPDPSLVIKMIEAKAKLIEATRKMEAVREAGVLVDG